MPTLELTDRARDDLLRIGEYIGEQQHRRSTAKRVIQGISKTCRRYARDPHIGQSAPELGIDLRLGIYQRWVIIYEPVEQGIRVLRIVDGARDYSKLFGNK